jgi:hypothetical protein
MIGLRRGVVFVFFFAAALRARDGALRVRFMGAC